MRSREKALFKSVDQIDEALCDEFAAVRQDLADGDRRLERLLAERDASSAAVFDLVRRDYEAQQASSKDLLEAIRQRMTEEHLKVAEVVLEFERALDEDQLQREEVDLRHRLGEFGDVRAEQMRQELDASREEKQGQLKRLEKIAEAFTAGLASPSAAQPEAAVGSRAAEAQPVGRLLPFVDGEADGDAERAITLGPETTIGRDDENTITINEHNVSRRHAKIEAAAGSFVVSDLASTNGTFINGSAINDGRPLANDDRLRIGTAQFIFRTQ